MTRATRLCLGLGLVALVNWGFHRVRPRVAELRALDAARARLDADASAAPQPAVRDAALREVDALDAEVDRLRAALAEADARIARPEQVPELQVQLASLAQDAGLRLEAADPSPADARVVTWTLRGSFRSLWAFLDHVARLPARVTLSDLELERPREPSAGPLRIRLKVAL